MKRIAGTLAAISLLTLGIAAAATSDEHFKVEINDKSFSPETAEVSVGQTVIWMNNTKNEHSVTARVEAAADQDKDKNKESKPLFDSGPIKPGATFEHKFSKAGTYEYACSMDKSMVGRVVVKAKP